MLRLEARDHLRTRARIRHRHPVRIQREELADEISRPRCAMSTQGLLELRAVIREPRVIGERLRMLHEVRKQLAHAQHSQLG
jgi:hypothetical protein